MSINDNYQRMFVEKAQIQDGLDTIIRIVNDTKKAKNLRTTTNWDKDDVLHTNVKISRLSDKYRALAEAIRSSDDQVESESAIKFVDHVEELKANFSEFKLHIPIVTFICSLIYFYLLGGNKVLGAMDETVAAMIDKNPEIATEPKIVALIENNPQILKFIKDKDNIKSIIDAEPKFMQFLNGSHWQSVLEDLIPYKSENISIDQRKNIQYVRDKIFLKNVIEYDNEWIWDIKDEQILKEFVNADPDLVQVRGELIKYVSNRTIRKEILKQNASFAEYLK